MTKEEMRLKILVCFLQFSEENRKITKIAQALDMQKYEMSRQVSVLGQSMTESATYREALIEIDPDGNMFATVRLKLMDNIKNPTFKVQNDGNSGFYDVDYDIMKEDYDKNECDFRFKIPSENCIVRCTFYVIAMGRDVIYYLNPQNSTLKTVTHQNGYLEAKAS